MSGVPGNTAETAASQAPLLEECPLCNYSLHTLPIECKCPECGQAIDRGWTVYGGAKSWRRFSRCMKGALLFLGGPATILAIVGRDVALAIFLIILVAHMLLMAAVGLWLLLGGKTFAVVTDDGLLLGNPRSRKVVLRKWIYVRTIPLLSLPIPNGLPWPRAVLVDNLPLWKIGIFNQVACARAIDSRRVEERASGFGGGNP